MSNSRGPSRHITLAQVRGAMRGLHDANELPATPREITEALDKDTTPKTVRKRLKELRTEGEVTKQESGPGYVWDLVPEEFDADADLTNQIAGVLQSAELEDIPTEQARWIAESLPASDFSDEKKTDIVEATDPSLLSDEEIQSILELANPQIISENKVKQIIESTEIDTEIFSDEIAEEIARERYGYVRSFWAHSYRLGIRLLAGAGVSTVFGFIILLTAFQLGPYNLPSIAGVSLPAVVIESQFVGAIAFIFGLLFFGLGLIYTITGVLGLRYSSVDDPRPWGDFVMGSLRKFID
ncbi:hypothetical protein HSRCO_3013 (plasmid) [Halanaeroarchaeum sp. HSR-CO]|uniref:hypothetical protein n=1 Tax=Halanaeroarchaeum sp. HSR-CO TaxID=2866382 RepID=UPI00217DAB96|nr:hypothetical protein [Halanaeroarchaeum sp. HSR-CO]UWG49154.1 hypothetical protein HSRCO_3013 [Halanaeroarchaeum sp. HSR-CO]